jgi:DNA-binding response OmpR family regulator
MEFEPYRIDVNNRSVTVAGEPIKLTQKEYELIVFLFKNIGRVVSRSHLLESVWGTNPEINTRTIDTHMSRIRSKLGIAPENGWRLSSIYQHGYRLEKMAQDAPR